MVGFHWGSIRYIRLATVKFNLRSTLIATFQTTASCVELTPLLQSPMSLEEQSFSHHGEKHPELAVFLANSANRQAGRRRSRIGAAQRQTHLGFFSMTKT